MSDENVIIDIAKKEIKRQRRHLRPNEQIRWTCGDWLLEIEASHVFYDQSGGFAEARTKVFFDAQFLNPTYAGMKIGEGIREMLYKLRNEVGQD